MSTINKIAIKNSLGEYDESKIGAQAEDVIISRDADGKIIETIETPGVVIGSTEGISTTIKEIDERIASSSSIGQVQIGTGLEIDNNGVLTPSFGNTTGSICEGNDPRLASIGTVANDLVLSSNGDGDAAGATFNGGAAVKISYNSVGAAPNQKATTSQWGQIKIKSNSGLGVDSTNGLSLSSHASASNTYGVGTNANYGHLKIVDATSSTSGTSYNAAAGVAASASSVADVISQISNFSIRKIAETGGDNAAGVNIGWLIQQYWDNLPLVDKLRSAIVINNYILRCTSLSQKTFSCATRYMNDSIYIWQEVIASQGQYVEVSGYIGSTINTVDYSTAHVGNAALYVL